MQRCADCSSLVWHPRYVCPHCGSDSLAWDDLSGDGVIHAVSVHHRSSAPALKDRTPFAVVLVDLVEGARVMSNVLSDTPQVGDAVTVDWEPLSDGRNLPVFRAR